jgi:riboflavin kinase/FMN adenylyltransferase
MRRAVVNIGYRPTLQKAVPELRVEAHLLDFTGDLAEQELEISFLKKLRDEERFPSLEALQTQIGKDVAAARQLFRSGVAQA